MTATHPDIVLRHLRDFASAEAVRCAPDRQLLHRFTQGRDEAAFTALVRRHGPLVLSVCRRVLHNSHDAEDAFQATFLVLAKKAADLDGQRPLGGWLYQVAYHMAINARKQAAARRKREARSDQRMMPDPIAEVSGRELVAVFDEEMQTLPASERLALVLCYFQSKTHDEAAGEIGCSLSTLKRRLESGKERLRQRSARRGVALTVAALGAALAEQGLAAVPAALIHAAVRTSLHTAGAVLTPAASLAAGALKATFLTKPKIAAAVLLLLGTLLAAGAWARQGKAQPPAPELTGAPPAATPQQAPAAPKEPKKPDGPTITVSGRVLDPQGKPLAGAQVAVCGDRGLYLGGSGWWVVSRNEVIGRTKTDADGKYRLTVKRLEEQMTFRAVRVVASADGYGLSWKNVKADADADEADVRLTAVQHVTGHIVGLQGEDVAGATIHVVYISRIAEKGSPWQDWNISLPADLGLTFKTDAKGNFDCSRFGSGLKLVCEIRELGYERKEEWIIETDDPKKCQKLSVVLPTGRYVEGRVVYEDTRKPVPFAKLVLANPIINAKTDAQGRFKVALFNADENGAFGKSAVDIAVHAIPPAGEPYIGAYALAEFPKGVVRREVEVVLPRAVLIHGRVTEAGSDKPVAGAYVADLAFNEHGTKTAADGSFRIGLNKKGGRLLVTHPSGEFIPIILGSGGGTNNPNGGSFTKPYGERAYYHAAADIKLAKDDKEKEVNFTLRRGVTVKGKFVGPDDKPVKSAVLLVSDHKLRFESTMHPMQVLDGRFELRGLDPDKKYRLLFLEHPRRPNLAYTVEAVESFGQLWLSELLGPGHKLGAFVEIDPKKVGDDLVVKLAPCGQAKVRFVDDKGKPLAGYEPWLQLVVTPGPTVYQALQDKMLAAEVITLIGRFQGGSANLKTDDKGYVTFAGLIPGAPYRLKKVMNDPTNEIIKEFSVEAGKTVEFEIVVK